MKIVSVLLSLSTIGYSATFGTVVPVRGTVSDIALSPRTGNLYIANFSAGRIEVMTPSGTLGTPILLTAPISAIAFSPDGRYLVAGQYDSFNAATPPVTGILTIFDLDAGATQQVSLPNPVLAVAFGSGSQALVVTGSGCQITTTTTTTTAGGSTTTTTGCTPTPSQILLLDPFTAKTQTLSTITLADAPLPVPFATFPANIIQASTGVSGDGNTIIVLAETGTTASASSGATSSGGATILSYHPGDTTVSIVQEISSPPLGPRAVSVSQNASSFLTAWVLYTAQGDAQFPYPLGDLRKGGHAFDSTRNVIYADIPVTATEAPVMHILDTDNLTVRERIQLPEMMAGRSLFSTDTNTVYAVSDSGVMLLPVGSLAKLGQVGASQEDVVFQADSCNRLTVSQSINIVDLNGLRTDFTLSLPTGTTGIRLSQTSGTTPAKVTITIDPTAFQSAKGTTTVMLNITSNGAVNIPFPVRLLINTRDFNQRGQVMNIPGKLVDILADPSRNRLYILRQDKNLVLVYDSTTFKQITTMRTLNTPVQMAMTTDQKYLIVGNDNSHYASVFDLTTLMPSTPIAFNAYPRTIGVANGAIWATARTVVTPPLPIGPSPLYQVDFANRVATAPVDLGVFTNGTPALDSAVLASTPSLGYLLLAIPDGTVAMWDSTVNLWVASRQDFMSLGGAYGALSDTRFVVDNNLLDQSLFPIAQFQSTTGGSSGVIVSGASAFRSTAVSGTGAGTLERVDLGGLKSFNATATAEAPQLVKSLQTPPIGQIGETILPFTRTLAVPADGSSIIMLTQSGITILPPNFDATLTVPTVSSVTNIADGGVDVTSGDLVTISGTGLAGSSASALGLPLPTSLGDACVTLSNVALPLFNVSPTQMMAQLPFNANVGSAPLVVHAPGGVGVPFPVNVQDFAPAIFRTGTAGTQTGIATVIRDTNNQLVDFTNPIHPNDTISIYMIGLGQTSPPAPFGDASPASPLDYVGTPPSVTLGGTPLAVTFAGLVPGEVGVYQVNAFVPGNVLNADQTPLVVMQAADSTTLQVRVVSP